MSSWVGISLSSSGPDIPKAAKRSASTCDMSAMVKLTLRGPSRSATAIAWSGGGSLGLRGNSRVLELARTRGAAAA